jgi:cellulase
MISNGGWVDFSMPSCVAPGQYLLRAEIIALHSASKAGQAQFYMVRILTHIGRWRDRATANRYQGCAQINVKGSGSSTGSQTVSFPGAYSASDPGILVSIYNSQGQPTGNGQYKIPGPSVLKC